MKTHALQLSYDDVSEKAIVELVRKSDNKTTKVAEVEFNSTNSRFDDLRDNMVATFFGYYTEQELASALVNVLIREMYCEGKEPLDFCMIKHFSISCGRPTQFSVSGRLPHNKVRFSFKFPCRYGLSNWDELKDFCKEIATTITTNLDPLFAKESSTKKETIDL